MFDVQIDGNRHHIPWQRVEEVCRTCAEVDHDFCVRCEAAHQAQIRPRSAGPAIEPAQIAERALHLLARRVVLVEQLGSDDAFHGTSRNVVRQAGTSTVSCASGFLASSNTSIAYGPGSSRAQLMAWPQRRR